MRIFRFAICLAIASGLTLPAQQSPRYYGAIDLGARGIKAFLYSFNREGEGPDARAVFKNEVNTKLVSGAQDGRFTDAGITEATEAVSTLLTELKKEAEKRQLPKVEYYIVGSSGVARFSNAEELKKSVDRATGTDMSFVDAAHEGYYGLLSAVPKSRRDVSLLIDIGSGNTKIGCLEQGVLRPAELPFASVTLRTAALKADPDFETGLAKVLDEQVRPAYNAQAQPGNCIADRQRVYWIGGAAWATATYAHPETALWGYVRISLKDIDFFLDELKDKSWLQRQPQFHFTTDVRQVDRQAIQAAHLADRKRVSEVFSREDLIAGVSLMKTMLQSHSSPPTVYFVRNGNYLFGYALEKFREDIDEGKPVQIDPTAPSYFAGIDIGARGVKAFVYSFVHEGDGADARAIFKDEVNTKLVSSAEGKRFKPTGIDEATEAATKLVSEMKAVAEKKRIAPHYYLVASSGVSRFENFNELKNSVERASGMPLDSVTVQQEGYFGLVSAMPAIRRQEGVHVDIGSSNTKLGCMTRDVFNPAEIAFGSVTLRKAAAPGPGYPAALRAVVASQVVPAYNMERMNTPCLASRSRIYFVGGVAWAMATFSHPETALWGYVPLTRNDIDVFLRHLEDETWNQSDPKFYFTPTVTASQREAIKAANAADRRSVQDVFSREDLMAGASLMRTVLESSNPAAKVYFVRNGNYLFGYALEKYKDVRFAEEGATDTSAAAVLPVRR